MTPAEMKEIRSRLGLTQAEFAKVICVAKNTISCYEWELCSNEPKLGANTSGSNIGPRPPITGSIREQTHVPE